ncbi:hypothetical protein ASPCADRAFT_179141 [Aspergillus carbonarius ITEM 5010]|uniref:DUF1907 domain-containing protein n=1 Tax=Aspergillus carbonarius (strain ITEM 5010) TaxID=602072 RepID=A0A1R3R7E5_ASPC5|nr:hypothetical protein ASPCADRAFT_179137 [Aspergillus carbonarius ITEM 5010]OOF90385.1 hypothetical protein ASPCADRAFT_179141 [Aspergillus carbonarius ITEM 5010]
MKCFILQPPPLEELRDVIQNGLRNAFETAFVEVTTCPDLSQSPFHLSAPGLCGDEKIADVGGPAYLQPVSDLTKKYTIPKILDLVGMEGQGFAIGAAGGPFHVVGKNSELVPNLARDANGKWQNLSRYVHIDDDEKMNLSMVPKDTKDCGLMANLFISRGHQGESLHIRAKGRRGQLNFPETIQELLRVNYGGRPVSLGGVFLVKQGKAKLHVMTDFSTSSCPGPDHEWFRYYEADAPIVCLTAFHSVDYLDWNLRMEHTHCFSESGVGGHYHYDTTPDDVEYEAWLNTAKAVYRIDQPPLP